jgi:hypothetical protein
MYENAKIVIGRVPLEYFTEASDEDGCQIEFRMSLE